MCQSLPKDQANQTRVLERRSYSPNLPLGGIWLEIGYALLKDRAHRVQARDNNELTNKQAHLEWTISPEVEFSVNLNVNFLA